MKIRTYTLLKKGIIFLILIIIVLFYSSVIEPNWIMVRNQKVYDARLSKILCGYTVIHISDLHISTIGFREKHTLKEIQILSPDIIFMTGDYIKRDSDYTSAQDFLENLSAKIGIYVVLGNTDHSNSEWIRNISKIKNIKVLKNESHKLVLDNKKEIWIVGVDDPYTYHDDLHYALQKVDMKVPFVVLSHTPEIVRDVVRIGRPYYLKQGGRLIPLVLCGHTHGGQIHFPFLGPIKYEMRDIVGLRNGDVTNVYITRGVGVGSIPFRFLCRPEIAVLDFCE